MEAGIEARGRSRAWCAGEPPTGVRDAFELSPSWSKKSERLEPALSLSRETLVRLAYETQIDLSRETRRRLHGQVVVRRSRRGLESRLDRQLPAVRRRGQTQRRATPAPSQREKGLVSSPSFGLLSRAAAQCWDQREVVVRGNSWSSQRESVCVLSLRSRESTKSDLRLGVKRNLIGDLGGPRGVCVRRVHRARPARSHRSGCGRAAQD